MNYKLLHIFRNTPIGRETFLQSLYFCKNVNAFPSVYIPVSDKFMMYFSNDAVQVDLDKSYLSSPDTALGHAEELFQLMGLKPVFYTPKNYTASSLPDISTHFDYLCCPRSVSDKSSKIGLGHIGPKVRRIVKHAVFPTLITSPVYKPWTRVAVLFGGSNNAIKALKLGIQVSAISGFPMDIFTLLENNTKDHYENLIRRHGLDEAVLKPAVQWHFYPSSQINEMLYTIPHDALIVMGAYGHGLIKEVLFGNKMEQVQSTVTNNLLVIGPNSAIEVNPDSHP